LARRQAVSQQILILPFLGSNPSAPAIFKSLKLFLKFADFTINEKAFFLRFVACEFSGPCPASPQNNRLRDHYR
jgi:hypothetical protein